MVESRRSNVGARRSKDEVMAEWWWSNGEKWWSMVE